ncbi:MAG: fumarylacetoacetate hydrolase family protein [Sandaracinaceae bacterium]|nr:fumarylacetoacetate hydrolase family protein [Sandaracinaceae bacterium]
MRLLRLHHRDRVYWASLEDEATARLWTGAPWEDGKPTDRLVPLREGALRAPVAPSKIVCVGRNYRAHAAELGNPVPAEPLLFLKPPSALMGTGQTIAWPAASERVDYEGEIAIVIGRELHHASEELAIASVFGVTCANDVTARDLQKKDVQFTRAKGFDTFCPCGPWIETDYGPLGALRVRTRVDGALRQDGSSADMIFPIASLLSYVSTVMTLSPGDLVLTGTPEGVAPLEAGQSVEIEVDGVGVLRSLVGARGA